MTVLQFRIHTHLADHSFVQALYAEVAYDDAIGMTAILQASICTAVLVEPQRAP